MNPLKYTVPSIYTNLSLGPLILVFLSKPATLFPTKSVYPESQNHHRDDQKNAESMKLGDTIQLSWIRNEINQKKTNRKKEILFT